MEKRADGAFYYEAPDKGRIDIVGAKIKPGQLGRPIKGGGHFKLQADRPERWICDGKQIMQINDKEKTVERFPIPPQARGINIMDGPLPFLFGMPAAKAKRRYKIKITKESDREVRLAVQPRWAQDAANWREAQVILLKPDYLPSAVQMIDPGGNLETVYTFSRLQANRKRVLPWAGDPFRPSLRGYRMVQRNPPVPAVLGEPWKAAKTRLEKAGYKVKLLRGKVAPNNALVFRVYEQKPKPATPLAKGATVELTLYNRPQTAGTAPGAKSKP